MAAPDPATAKRHHGVRGPGAAGPRPATGGALPGRAAGGVAFAVFGAGKFTNHASELASFNTYHRPAPNTFVYLGGVIELAGLLPPQYQRL